MRLSLEDDNELMRQKSAENVHLFSKKVSDVEVLSPSK